MIPGVAVTVDSEAVVVTAEAPLDVVSSAPLRGGVTTARSIINLHVPKTFAHDSLEPLGAAVVRRRGLPTPWMALATAARTQGACVASESSRGVTALAVVTVGLSNVIAAGITSVAAPMLIADDVVAPTAPPSPCTINTIVIVDGIAETAALVNAIITATEVKTSVLAAAGVRCATGQIATGTSTDAVVVAATGRGRVCQFGGPISDLGWLIARTVRTVMEAGVRGWLEAHPA